MPARTGLRTSCHPTGHCCRKPTAVSPDEANPCKTQAPALAGGRVSPSLSTFGQGLQRSSPSPSGPAEPSEAGSLVPTEGPYSPGPLSGSRVLGATHWASRSGPLCCLSLLLCCSGHSGGDQAPAPPIAPPGVGEQRAEGHSKRVMDLETRAQSQSWGGGAQEATGVQGEAPPAGVGSPSLVTSQ